MRCFRWFPFLFVVLPALGAQEIAMPTSQTAIERATMSGLDAAWMKNSSAKLERDLVSKYGEAQRHRIQQGLRQVTEFWRPKDGGAAEFESFVTSNFAGDQAALDTVFSRFERLLEQLDGHMHEINREF